VFEYRVGGINARRHAYLDKLAQTDRLLHQRSLVEAMIYPLAEQLILRPEGNYYVRFLERIRRERVRDMVLWARHSGLPIGLSEEATSWAGLTGASKMVADMAPLFTSWVEVEQRIARTLAWLPPAVADFRVQLTREQAVSGLASIEEMLEIGATSPTDVPRQVEMMIDATVAILTGPISPRLSRMLGFAKEY
jgi:hypothetical protein